MVYNERIAAVFHDFQGEAEPLEQPDHAGRVHRQHRASAGCDCGGGPALEDLLALVEQAVHQKH
jgi:hypothetical protein